MARVSPPERIEKPNPKYTENIAFPKSPNTIDGTPESISMDFRIRMMFLLFLSENSDKNKEDARPIGMTTRRQIATIRIVDIMIGNMPPFLPPEYGESQRKFQEKCCKETVIMSPSMKTRTTITNIPTNQENNFVRASTKTSLLGCQKPKKEFQ
jgi:hypothetical protein